MADKKWLQTAIKRPGRMRDACKRRGHTGATCKCMREIVKTTKDRSLKSAAILGLRLRGCSGVKGRLRKAKRPKASRRR